MAKTATVQNRLKDQLIAAEKRLTGLEKEAQKVVADLGGRIKTAREEVQEVLKKAQEADFAERAEELKQRLEGAGDDMAKKINRFQVQAFERLGIARREEVTRLGRDLSKVARKLESVSRQLATRKPGVRRKAPHNAV